MVCRYFLDKLRMKLVKRLCPLEKFSMASIYSLFFGILAHFQETIKLIDLSFDLALENKL